MLEKARLVEKAYEIVEHMEILLSACKSGGNVQPSQHILDHLESQKHELKEFGHRPAIALPLWPPNFPIDVLSVAQLQKKVLLLPSGHRRTVSFLPLGRHLGGFHYSERE